MRKFVAPIILAASLGLIYLATIAPGLTWANYGSDGGDFITAAATGGIAHPTGYPLYLLIAKIFQLLPIGSLAFRTNLLSMLAAILAACLVYAVLVYPAASPARGNWLAGLSAGYALGLSPVFWSQAVITEVYTLHTALVALSFLLAVWQPAPEQTWATRLRGLIPGLAVGNHLTAIFLLPGALLSGIWKGNWKINWLALARLVFWYAAGLMIYLALPLRALSKPLINWGNPLNLENFTWLVTGNLYQRYLTNITGTQLLDRGQSWAFLMLRQFEAPGLLLGLVGLIYFFKPVRLYFISIYYAIAFSFFAILYTSFDSYVYLLPVFLSFSVWIGLGVAGILDWARQRTRFATPAAASLLLAGFVALTILRWPQVDASHDLRAEQYGARLMLETPPNAIIFTKSDRAIFTLWYFHFALKQRPDLTVIATELLHFEWYAATLRATYPGINWPEGFLWVENITPSNASRPICNTSYYDEEVFSCP